jgi:outer membrane protein OmpA-like peptidoglycan-associated protein
MNSLYSKLKAPSLRGVQRRGNPETQMSSPVIVRERAESLNKTPLIASPLAGEDGLRAEGKYGVGSKFITTTTNSNKALRDSARSRRMTSQTVQLLANSAWSEISVSQKQITHQSPNTINNGLSLRAGTLIAVKNNFSLGVFVAGNNNLITQEKLNRATVNSIEGGFYGGLFNKNAEFKFHISVGEQNFSTFRNVNDNGAYGEFSAMVLKAGAEAAYVNRALRFFDLKPFIGFRTALINNEAINEKGDEEIILRVDSRNYQSFTSFAGLKLEKVKESFSWYLKGEAGYLFLGNNETSKYQMVYKNFPKEKFIVRGLEIDPLIFGLGVGIDTAISKRINLYALAQVNKNASVTFGQASVGIKLKFKGKNKKANAMALAMIETGSFEINSFRLTPIAIKNIKTIAKEILKTKFNAITVQGHTDTTGSKLLNNNLSLKRAKAVREELIKNGVPKEKVRAIGLGSKTPIADNTTEEGRTKNRRAEVFVE